MLESRRIAELESRLARLERQLAQALPRPAGPRSTDRIFPAEVTGGSAGAGYEWTEQDQAPDGTYSDKSTGRDDTQCGLAFEFNDLEVTPPTIVAMHERTDPATGELSYGFSAGAAQCETSTGITELGGTPGDCGAEAANWAIGAGPVQVQTLRNICWDSDALQLTGYYTDDLYDSCGKLVSVSAETDFVIFTAEDCETTEATDSGFPALA